MKTPMDKAIINKIKTKACYRVVVVKSKSMEYYQF
jgi:hypothetical protein